MRFTIVLAVLLYAFVVYTEAQNCRRPSRPNCTDGRDAGRAGRSCPTRRMWYYEGGQCREMMYRGCGGNNNRYCSKAECERSCRRSG